MKALLRRRLYLLHHSQILNSFDIKNYTLLEAPLSVGSAMDASLQKRLSELKQAADRLCFIPAYDSLI